MGEEALSFVSHLLEFARVHAHTDTGEETGPVFRIFAAAAGATLSLSCSLSLARVRFLALSLSLSLERALHLSFSFSLNALPLANSRARSFVRARKLSNARI